MTHEAFLIVRTERVELIGLIFKSLKSYDVAYRTYATEQDENSLSRDPASIWGSV